MTTYRARSRGQHRPHGQGLVWHWEAALRGDLRTWACCGCWNSTTYLYLVSREPAWEASWARRTRAGRHWRASWRRAGHCVCATLPGGAFHGWALRATIDWAT